MLPINGSLIPTGNTVDQQKIQYAQWAVEILTDALENRRFTDDESVRVIKTMKETFNAFIEEKTRQRDYQAAMAAIGEH